MYQVTFSINKGNLSWFKSIEDALNVRVKRYCGVIAYTINGGRVNVSIAAEPHLRGQINKVIKETLVEMFSTVCKMQFLKKHLVLPQMRGVHVKILIHTLVAFDRECEQELISEAFAISSGIALDGIYNFRLKELRARWIDICKLTEENAMYLSDEATFTELIRFLISAINPKIPKITIASTNDKYRLSGELNKEKVNMEISKEDLLYYLVDLAPMEIVLLGDFTDKGLYNQITQLFDAKHCRQAISPRA